VNPRDLNPLAIGASLLRHRAIIAQLTRRDLLLKYRGAYFGIAWAFLYPLLLLAVFSLVFGSIVPARWGDAGAGQSTVLWLYSGLVVFSFFAEAVSRAPAVVRGYPAFVKKVLFPVETLPVTLVGTAVLHLALNLAILAGATLVSGSVHATILLAPVVLLPAVLVALGCAWLAAAVGVFIRDLVNIIPILVQGLLFLSPIFYSLDAVPAHLRPFLLANPLTVPIEQLREVLFLGRAPDWGAWLAVTVAGIAVAGVGYAVFQHLREEFADAL
jgi:lipopolysaccharide transport system permease protein